MHRNFARAAVVPFALLPALALAQPADLTVDANESSIDLTVTLDTALGARTDSDSAPISGTMQIELDSYDAPTTITVIDYDLNAGALSFVFDYSFLGSVTASAANLSLRTPVGAPPAVGVVLPDGSFTVDSVPNETAGTIVVSGTGVVGSLITGTTLDLSTLAQEPIQISGIVDVAAGTVMLSVALPLDSTGTDPASGATVTLIGSAAVLATGPVPEQTCPADTNNDGEVTPADFSAWIAAFNSQSPACDQNADTLCTAADFSAWIANFNAGC